MKKNVLCQFNSIVNKKVSELLPDDCFRYNECSYIVPTLDKNVVNVNKVFVYNVTENIIEAFEPDMEIFFDSVSFIKLKLYK